MTRTQLPAHRAVRPHHPTSHPWRISAVALAAAMLIGLPATDAQALSLGRASVQSAIGAPLQAEIELPQITPDELSTLTVTLASQDTFRAAGLEYSPVLGSLHISFHRRANGTSYLRLTSDRVVNEPFVDVLIEATWATGRIVRDYTLLFDPPAVRPATAPMAPQLPPTRAPAPAPITTPAQGLRAPRGPVGLAPGPAPQPAAAAPAPSPDPRRVTVKAGDTAGELAAANKPASVSLDQMLVAVFRSNPQAFSGGNMNRLKAGVVLELPSAEQAASIDAAQARQVVVAQSRDFNEFRRRLAEGVSSTPHAEAVTREAAGRLQAQLDEKRPGAAAPDKLMLSKGAVQGRTSADHIAKDRAAQDAATRVAELNRNIDELNRLTAATGATGPSSGAAGAATGGPPLGVPAAPAPAATASAATSAEPPAADTPAAASPSTPAGTTTTAESPPAVQAASAAVPATAPAPAAAPAARPTPDPLQATTPGITEELLENPLLPAAGGGVLALLLGLALLRLRQRRKAHQVDSSFLESRLQPDSFFGASGGQRIDTAEGASVTGSSMVYSPSQLDAAGDVDPVAEADVYLAYGRDLQAEEILKEALRTTPQRVAVHTKMLEIYAKRGDAKAFEQLATETHALTQGQGPDWAHICTLGEALDPGNALYRPGGPGAADVPARPRVARTDVADPAPPAPPAPARSAPLAAAAAAVQTSVAAAADKPTSASDSQSGPSSVLDFDLDLDLSGHSGPAPLPAAADATPADNEPPAPAPEAATEAAPLGSLPDLDFGALGDLPPAPPAAAAVPPAPPLPQDNSLKFDLDLDVAGSPHGDAAAAPSPDKNTGELMNFDLGSLDLDLPPAAPAASAPVAQGDSAEPPEMSFEAFDSAETDDADPLATKLALAEEFNAIGDADGARSLAEEVLAEASGEMRERAQRFLAEIG